MRKCNSLLDVSNSINKESKIFSHFLIFSSRKFLLFLYLFFSEMLYLLISRFSQFLIFSSLRCCTCLRVRELSQGLNLWLTVTSRCFPALWSSKIYFSDDPLINCFFKFRRLVPCQRPSTPTSCVSEVQHSCGLTSPTKLNLTTDLLVLFLFTKCDFFSFSFFSI